MAESDHSPRTDSSASLLTRWAERHLFDYPRPARLAWLVLVLTGLACGLAAAASVALLPTRALVEVLLGLVLVAAAAWWPVNIPRTRYFIGATDVVVFVLLGLHGWAAAALAGAVEGMIGGYRSSKRVSSRISTPSVACTSLVIAGLAVHGLEALVRGSGLSAGSVTLAVPLVAVIPYFAGSTLPLLAMMQLKSGRPQALRPFLAGWLQNYGWLGAIYLGSALIAGVLVINARQFGPGIIAVVAIGMATLIVLARRSLNHHEEERQQQESSLAQARREAELNHQRFMAAFTYAAVGMAIVQADGRLRQVNLSLCRLLGRASDSLIGAAFESVLDTGDVTLLRRRILQMGYGDGPGAATLSAEDDGSFSMELRCVRSDGQELWVSLHCSRFIDPGDAGSALIYQLHDITSRRLAEHQLQHTAYHDSLTDLPNRHCFNERLAIAVEGSAGDPRQTFAVLFLDLDRFKTVNDSLGHAAGNALLCETARRLTQNVRPGDLVARLGGDEFAILAEHLQAPEQAMAMADRLLSALQPPVMIYGTDVRVGASIGLTVSDLGYRTADEILRDADLAMYAAKAEGRGRVMLFDQAMHERVSDRLRLENDLRRAIGEGQLTLNFQPLFELDPYRLSGFEALARWVHPERGPVSPAVFVTLAEETGHIEALTRWVIEQAAAQVAVWRRAMPQLLTLDMHVNISAQDLCSSQLVPYVREVLGRYGLEGRVLTLEITETSLMRRIDMALETLGQLRALGVRFSIDDFGTGYSSLAYLSTLPIDSLKIDRSFVVGMGETSENVEIVRAMQNLGHTLGKTVIAEGIETTAQLEALRKLGVQVGQGYLLARPLTAAAAADLLAQPAVLMPH